MPDPKRSAAAKKAAATRRRNQEQREREKIWQQRIKFLVGNALGAGLLINEARRPAGPNIVMVGAGLSALGLNVAEWLDRLGMK